MICCHCCVDLAAPLYVFLFHSCNFLHTKKRPSFFEDICNFISTSNSDAIKAKLLLYLFECLRHLIKKSQKASAKEKLNFVTRKKKGEDIHFCSYIFPPRHQISDFAKLVPFRARHLGPEHSNVGCGDVFPRKSDNCDTCHFHHQASFRSWLPLNLSRRDRNAKLFRTLCGLFKNNYWCTNKVGEFLNCRRLSCEADWGDGEIGGFLVCEKKKKFEVWKYRAFFRSQQQKNISIRSQRKKYLNSVTTKKISQFGHNEKKNISIFRSKDKKKMDSNCFLFI